MKAKVPQSDPFESSRRLTSQGPGISSLPTQLKRVRVSGRAKWSFWFNNGRCLVHIDVIRPGKKNNDLFPSESKRFPRYIICVTGWIDGTYTGITNPIPSQTQWWNNNSRRSTSAGESPSTPHFPPHKEQKAHPKEGNFWARIFHLITTANWSAFCAASICLLYETAFVDWWVQLTNSTIH